MAKSKKHLCEVHSLFSGRNDPETLGRHEVKHLCLTPGKLSRNIKYEIPQSSSKHSHWSLNSLQSRNFSPGFAKAKERWVPLNVKGSSAALWWEGLTKCRDHHPVLGEAQFVIGEISQHWRKVTFFFPFIVWVFFLTLLFQLIAKFSFYSSCKANTHRIRKLPRATEHYHKGTTA